MPGCLRVSQPTCSGMFPPSSDRGKELPSSSSRADFNLDVLQSAEANRHPFETYDDIHVDHPKSDGKVSLELLPVVTTLVGSGLGDLVLLRRGETGLI